jgi:hypothetical protein
MAGTAMRFGVADFASQEPECDESPAGMQCSGSHCRKQETASTMLRDR